MDATYNLAGGFKPTLKRFADLEGPDFFPTPAWATYALHEAAKTASLNCGQERRLKRVLLLIEVHASRNKSAHGLRVVRRGQRFAELQTKESC